MDEFERALDFVTRADMFGSQREPFAYGTAVFEPRLPLRHDSNYLLAERLAKGVTARNLADEAERLQGAARLGHRCVLFRDARDGDRLAPGLEALGWSRSGGIVMRLRGPPPTPQRDDRVRLVALGELEAARAALVETYPWGTPAVARQLAGARALGPVPVRHFAVLEGGRPVAWVDLLLCGETVQVEELATLEAHRGRGHARALMERALREAAAAEATFVLLCADEHDWPRRFYERLGFETLGRYVKHTRQEGQD